MVLKIPNMELAEGVGEYVVEAIREPGAQDQ